MVNLMTLKCKDCEHVYGRWRPRCPACGTVNPEPMQAAVDAMTREERSGQKGRIRMPKPPKAPRGVKDPCSCCGKGGAKNICLVCGKPMHKHCRWHHEKRCQFVQVENIQERLAARIEEEMKNASDV